MNDLHTAKRVSGFTLVETLIAIGALLLIALGLAKIFDSTGKTVTAGRQVSVMTEYAAMLESRFRADFDDMTRDGFLIIRNEYANLGVEVALHSDDRTPRLRRVDELMFFKKGKVSSAREALASGFPAVSNEAAVYYGHGQQRREDFRNRSFYRRPQIHDFNFDAQAQLGFPTPRNPNRYASSWNLLRHVTVLVQPPTTLSKEFGNGLGQTPVPPVITNIDWLFDSDFQIGLRPALSSLFRAISVLPPAVAPPPGLYVANDQDPPQASSGIVDIATTDLDEIRQIVTTVESEPGNVKTAMELQALLKAGYTRGAQISLMQHWMEDALPAWSNAQDPDQRSRMRCEPSAPDFMGVLTEMQGSPSPTEALINAIERANQLAVASSVFVPSCTEFIVEWSFGKVDTSGRVIWHGKERRVDFNGDGALDANELVASPYEASTFDEMAIPFRIRDAQTTVSEDPNNQNSPAFVKGYDEWPVTAQLIHGGTSSPAFAIPLTSYFGYFDPMFNPNRRGKELNQSLNRSALDKGDALSPTIPWAWPELIRITMTLADPIDLTVEQSFQFVLDAPGTPVN